MRDERFGAAQLTLPGGGTVCLAWTTASSVDEGDAWLTPAEKAILDRFRVSKRAADWRLGRWVAKEAVASALRARAEDGSAPDIARAEIEIRAGPGGGPRARVLAPGEWPAMAVSLSHAAGVGFATAAVGPGRLGCDVEEIAPRSGEFVSDYFTADEAVWVRAGGEERHVRANLLWSAKESALKALGEGLRKDTRGVVVEVQEMFGDVGAGWRPLSVTSREGEGFAGWWKVSDGCVWTVVG
jgi:4'-phosphopantetheinyl transferase